MPNITIVTVNWWGARWLNLLDKSAAKLASRLDAYKILVVDNSQSLASLENTQKGLSASKAITPDKNLGHGPALDYAIREHVDTEYVFVMDVDAHLLLQDWDQRLPEFLESNGVDLMACVGGMLKPVRPCGMFFRRDYFVDNGMSFVARELDGAKDDVGVHFYRKTLSLGGRVHLLPYRKTQYKAVVGNEYALSNVTVADDNRFLYHNWYGTRWYDAAGNRTRGKIDRMEWARFEEAREALFGQAFKKLR